MKKYYLALLILVCFFSTVDASPRSKVVLMGLGAAFAISAAQCFIAALGFTATGIAAGSWAAKLMSIVASFNGGSVPPGSFVTTLQSIDCLPTKACDIMPFMFDMGLLQSLCKCLQSGWKASLYIAYSLLLLQNYPLHQ
ncbi:uncharacterized protein LOC121291868 isoform X1 [Carcharodon carcharias]|uniref:uncharacterized protein LOC121291868 isoform X1 n=1 Tax=Carcharodon carcharias TaxID=13397 RepID=UPI001B7E6F35|nr:uncharacterized protein LOC121291868 isoform X1 [Carcharodon carcharias]XP_041069425.1 uncharacterized protein LOC121291868 isoform X1 [Carcharodon carcharias]